MGEDFCFSHCVYLRNSSQNTSQDSSICSQSQWSMVNTMDGIGLISIFSDVNAVGFGLQSLEKASVCKPERFATQTVTCLLFIVLL